MGMDCLRCRTSEVIASHRRSNPFFAFLFAFLLAACSDFFEPVESTPEPTEYGFNYWLLQRTYLFEDELPQLDENGDSVSELYGKLSDRFTRYVAPTKSEETITHINTSLVPGDIGLEYAKFDQLEHPIIIYRVYAESPAGRAGVPRYGNILSVNGIEISGDRAYAIYDSILSYNKNISLKVSYSGDTSTYKLVKEDVYAPTVFVDTINETAVITITGFKLKTADQKNGTKGEMRTYLESTRNSTEPRLIDLRNNPGGHVDHCTEMADLFIESGITSIRSRRTFTPDGKRTRHDDEKKATPGDAGENGKFVVLVNKHSASCAEIFAAALQEGAGIPIAGDVTYGKGIGQSTWKTPAGGLAIITNIEFLTPNGNSYHQKGITPDYLCEDASLECGLEALQKYYGVKVLKKGTNNFLGENHTIQRRYQFDKGAFVEGSF